MRIRSATRQSRQTGVGDIDDGNANIVTLIRPTARIVMALQVVGLRVELVRVGNHILPIVTKDRSA